MCVLNERSVQDSAVWKGCPHLPEALTNEEDGKGDEEQKNMWDHIESIKEAAVVQNAPVHVVGWRVILIPTERQGHGGTGTLQANSRGNGGGGGGGGEGGEEGEGRRQRIDRDI